MSSGAFVPQDNISLKPYKTIYTLIRKPEDKRIMHFPPFWNWRIEMSKGYIYKVKRSIKTELFRLDSHDDDDDDDDDDFQVESVRF